MKVTAFLVASFAFGFVVASGTYSSAVDKIRRYPVGLCDANVDGVLYCPHVSSELLTLGEVDRLDVDVHYGSHAVPPHHTIPVVYPFAKACVRQNSFSINDNFISCGPAYEISNDTTEDSEQVMRLEDYPLDNVNYLSAWHTHTAGYPYVIADAGHSEGTMFHGYKVVNRD
ncbi:hypothetical protein WMF30_23045 [Sorangium sp. So ce134]